MGLLYMDLCQTLQEVRDPVITQVLGKAKEYIVLRGWRIPTGILALRDKLLDV